MALPSLTLRNTKGSALTYTELDNNFTNLSTATVSVTVGSTTTNLSLNDTLTFVAGSNITLTGDSASKTITIASTATGGGGGLANVVEDLSPQLGGNLDVQTYSIISTSDRNITIAPDGTGDVYLTSDTLFLGDYGQPAKVTTNGGIQLTINTNNTSTGAQIVLDNGINGNLYLDAEQSGGGGVLLRPGLSGTVTLDHTTWPGTAGSDGQILVNNAGNSLEWKYPETLQVQVYNADSVTINKGEPVYVFGSNGSNVSVKRALNTTDATSAQTLGLAAANISAGATGYVITRGLLKNCDTSAYTDGQGLYLGSTAGSKTTTKPYAPNHLVYLGFVEVGGSASAGRIFVTVQNGYELDELHDVNINHNVSIANRDYLVYNSSNSLWENRQLNTATNSIVGGVIVGSGLTIAGDGTLSATAQALTTATASTLGGVKIGSGISITGDGTISASGGGDTIYTGSTSMSGTLTPNISSGTVHTYTLTGNITMNTVTNITSGQTMSIILTQDGTGSRTLTNTAWKWAGGYKTLSTAANSIDIVTVSYIGTTYYASLTRGFV